MSDGWSSRSACTRVSRSRRCSMRSKFSVLERRTMPRHVVALVEQQLGQVPAVLAGDAGDQRASHGRKQPGSGAVVKLLADETRRTRRTPMTTKERQVPSLTPSRDGKRASCSLWSLVFFVAQCFFQVRDDARRGARRRRTDCAPRACAACAAGSSSSARGGGDDGVAVGADQARGAGVDGLGALGGGAHHQHRHAERRRFFLDAAGVGDGSRWARRIRAMKPR